MPNVLYNSIIIAEKPSQANSYKSAFKNTGTHQVGDYRYYSVAPCEVFPEGALIFSAVGHLLTLAEPHTYQGLERLANWDLNDIPMPIPLPYKYEPVKKTENVLKAIASVTRAAINRFGISNMTFIGAADIDNEGSAIHNLIFRHILTEQEMKQVKFKRLFINSMEAKAVYRGFCNLESNEKDLRMAESGFTRAAADWNMGLNMTRLLTIRSKQVIDEVVHKMNNKVPFVNEKLNKLPKKIEVRNRPNDKKEIATLFNSDNVYTGEPVTVTADDVFSSGAARMGRVVTNICHFIYERENEIDNFVEQNFYELHAEFQAANGSYRGKVDGFKTFEVSELQQKLTMHSLEDSRSYAASVTALDTDRKKSSSPALHSLTTLQAYANKKWKVSAKQVLSAAQSLYEKHKLTTYPRTECQYLTNLEYDYLKGNLNEYKSALGWANIATPQLDARKRYINPSAVEEHHALTLTRTIPTKQKLDELSPLELKIYMEVARTTIGMFCEDYVYDQTEVITTINNLDFRSIGKAEVNKGFKVLWEEEEVKAAPKKKANSADDSEEDANQSLPILKLNESVNGIVRVNNGSTKPPNRYSEATLLKAMETAGRFVEDVEDSEILKEVDGIGTPATRADAIESLKVANYVDVEKNKLVPTAKLMIICKLTEETVMANPIQSAKWQKYLKLIKDGTPGKTYMNFMEANQESVKGFKAKVLFFSEHPDVQKYIAVQILRIQKANANYVCPVCRSGQVKLFEKKDKSSSFYACSHFFDNDNKCKFIMNSNFGGHKFTKAQVQKLLTKGETGVIKTLKSSKDPKKPYAANIKLNLASMKFELEFATPTSPKTKK